MTKKGPKIRTAMPRRPRLAACVALAVVLAAATACRSRKAQPGAAFPPAQTAGPERAATPAAGDPWAKFRRVPTEYMGDFGDLRALLPFWPRLPEPGPDDWLTHFPEHAQTTANLLARASARARDRTMGVAIQPILPLDSATTRSLRPAARFLEIVYQCPVRVRPAMATPAAYFRNRKQLDASRLLQMLGTSRPADVWGFAGVTAFDLGIEELNFVFGLGAPDTGVNVTSTMRQASPDPVVARRRMLMTMAHELGHALGLAHCIAGSCLMNGSNHLAESDAQPALFCPHCTAKLRALRGIDPARVFCGLVQFFEEQGLTADRDLARKACEALKNGE